MKLKDWVTGGTKIQPRIASNWRIFESNWFDIECQIDATLYYITPHNHCRII